jgi:hypothetical protein
VHATFSLTDRGREVASALREHLTRDRRCGTFSLDQV